MLCYVRVPYAQLKSFSWTQGLLATASLVRTLTRITLIIYKALHIAGQQVGTVVLARSLMRSPHEGRQPYGEL